MTKTLQKGFTLIELMIVVAIIGILAAVALPAYQDYINNSNMAKVTSHYEEGVRYAQNEFRKIQSELALGIHANAAAADTANPPASWLIALNGQTPGDVTTGGKAPGGGPAYVDTPAGGDPATGSIGVVVSGSIATAGANGTSNFQIIFTRPAYLQLTEEIRTVAWSEI